MPTLYPHYYAHWLENRHVNVRKWWSAVALVHELATLAFDKAYSFSFPADTCKSMGKHLFIDMR